MTAEADDFRHAVDAARKQYEEYGRSTEFRNYWLGFNEESREIIAQQIRVFGALLEPVTDSLSGWHILDVGCGNGRWLRRMIEYDAKPEDVVGIDVTDSRFAIGRAKNPLLKLVKTDGVSIPFEDGRFDLVTQFVCFSSMATVSLRRQVAAEMARVVKAGGYVLWWDLMPTVAADGRNAPIDPKDYFDWPIRRLEVNRWFPPSESLRAFRGARWLGKALDALQRPPTHVAALIGPKR